MNIKERPTAASLGLADYNRWSSGAGAQVHLRVSSDGIAILQRNSAAVKLNRRRDA
ncbi:hypothetical protein [Phenylobacterium sp.]|uniref:hypothetical protein n=1 Tax=Phenylobacterium sp. TaxID=1871053 RepID=UPI002F3EE9D7